MTEDGKQKTEKVAPLRRCLKSPIIRQTGCAFSSRCQFLQENDRETTKDECHIRLGRIDRLFSKIKLYAEPYGPRAKPAIFKLILFHRNVFGRSSKALRPLTSNP